MPTGKHLCVIDNDPIYLFTLKKTLELMNGFTQLQMFEDGRRAITFLQQHIAEPAEFPDIIFLDINMPVLDGWGFIEEFNDMSKSIPHQVNLYLLTSSIDDEDRERALSYPCVSGYRIKPLSHQELEELLSELAIEHA